MQPKGKTKRCWNHLRRNRRGGLRRRLWKRYWKNRQRFNGDYNYNNNGDNDGDNDNDNNDNDCGCGCGNTDFVIPQHIRDILENPSVENRRIIIDLADADDVPTYNHEMNQWLAWALYNLPYCRDRDKDISPWEGMVEYTTHIPFLIALLECPKYHGHDLDLEFGVFNTPLYYAITERQWEKARILLDYGASPERYESCEYWWRDQGEKWDECWKEFLNLPATKSANKM